MSPLVARASMRWPLAATLALLATSILSTAPAEAANLTTFSADADAQVFADTPTANYGSSANLKVDGSPVRRSYIRFNVTIPKGAVVTRTTLRLYFTSSSSSSVDIQRAPSSWDEGTITYNNAPGLGIIVGAPTTVASGWNGFAIQPALPNRPVTYVVTRASDVGLTAQSRESATPPQLLVEYAFPTTTTTTIPATPPTTSVSADARVEQANPNTNFRTSYLRATGGSDPDVASYLRFSVGGFLGRIQSAKLRVFAYTSTADGPAVYATSNNWTEGGITWKNRPLPTSSAGDDKGVITAGTWVEYDVTPLVRANGTYSLMLASSSADPVDFYSREGPSAPQLVITTTPGHLEVRSWDLTMSYETAIADLNGDGLDDFFASRLGELNPRTSLQGADGSFVSGFTFPQLDRHGCTAGDVNGDGLVDLYCAIGAFRGTALDKENELWMAQPDGTYVNQAAAWGVDDPTGRGRRALFLDFNNDGLLDLYIANFGPRPDGLRSENMLFLNTGGSFVEEQVGATGLWGTACVDDGDWDRDGFGDLLICGDQLHLFHDGAGQSLDLSDALLGSEQVNWPRDATLEDLNGDGLPDLIVVTATELQIRLNRGQGALFGQVDKRVSLVDGRAVSVGDFTGDGVPDVYVAQGFGSDRNVDDMLLAGPAWLRAAAIQAKVGTGCTANSLRVLGRPAALVTNGCDVSRGPLQLISYHDD